MTNHYENLGVSETATGEELKRAYREKAKTLHPDVGGDAVEFAAVNQAYNTLKDPVRRQLYDATGQDARPPIEIEVQNILMQIFNEALAQEQDVEILAYVREKLKGGSVKIDGRVKGLKARKVKLTSKRGKIKAKGVNVAHLIIDKELQSIDAQLADLDHQTVVGKECLKALKAYSEEWEAPQYQVMDSRQQFTIRYL